MNLWKFADLLDRAADRMTEALVQAEQETVAEATEKAIEFSSGTLTAADRRQMDYPFARRHGSPLAPVDMINYDPDSEGGDHFRDRWKKKIPVAYSHSIISGIFNDSDHAGFLAKGTDKMFARPVTQRIADEVRESRRERIWRAVVATLKGQQ